MCSDVGATAIVQARASSTRLPGKVLADVCGEPMLALLLRRTQRARRLTSIVVATSDDTLDDSVADLALALGVGVHRGSLDDVLGRFVGAIGTRTGPIVRLTGDCPLVDPAVIDQAVSIFDDHPECGYVSNVEPRTYPDGVDVEVMAPGTLRTLSEEVVDPEDREHVTSALRRAPSRWPPLSVPPPPGESLAALRWTVDDQDDLDFVRSVVERLGERRYDAGVIEILEAVRRPPPLANHGLRG